MSNWLQKIAQDEGYIEDPSGQTFWGSRGSGCLFVRNHPTFGYQILAIHRAPEVEQGGTWGTTGGAVPAGENDLLASALRETQEEIGSVPQFKKLREWTWQVPNGDFTFTNYVLEVLDPNWEPGPFNWEVQDARWVTMEESGGLDLHFGLRALLDSMQQPEQEEQYDDNEKWLRRVSQKYMPLPAPVPPEERSLHQGVERMDERMTQETADQLRQQYPEIEYGGAGTFGTAFQTGPNEILKVTHSWEEANRAQQVFERPMDWIVPVLAEPQMIQENPPMWGIRMKKLQIIDDVELEIFVTQLGFKSYLPDFDSNWAQEMIQDMIQKDSHLNVQNVAYIWDQVQYILEQNNDTFGIEIHGGNVGWDDDGRLKVFDLGDTTYPKS